MLGGNPAYDAPADLSFADKITKVKDTLRLGSYLDETAALSTWYVPRAHEYEAWGDVRAMDGAVTLVQPLIALAVDDGMSDVQLLARMVGEPASFGSEIVPTTFHRSAKGLASANFDRVWNAALQRGVLEWAQSRPVPTGSPESADIVAALADAKKATRSLGLDNLEVNDLPDRRSSTAGTPTTLVAPSYPSRSASSCGTMQRISRQRPRKRWASMTETSFASDGRAARAGGCGAGASRRRGPLLTLHLGGVGSHAGRYGGLPSRAADDRYAAPTGIYPFVRQSARWVYPRIQRVRHSGRATRWGSVKASR